MTSIVADGARGFIGQLYHLVQWNLTTVECAVVANALALHRPADDRHARAILEEYIHKAEEDDGEELSWLADAIEEHTQYYWYDGDVFIEGYR